MASLLTILMLLAFPIIFHGASAIITINHGQVQFTGTIGVTVTPVEGVVALNLDNNLISHYLDCKSTGNVNNLAWERQENDLRFPVTIEGDILRLNLAPAGSPRVSLSDLDYYTCYDTITLDSATIKFAAGISAVCPPQEGSVFMGRLGMNVSLRVVRDGDNPISPSDLMWVAPDNTSIASGEKYTFMDQNRVLLIEELEIEDSGTYTINFRGSTITVTVAVHFDPTFLLNPVSVVVLEHDTATLICIFTGFPNFSYRWEREGGTLPVGTRTTLSSPIETNRTHFTLFSAYEITPVFYEDEGRYRCVATNYQVGNLDVTTASAYANLTVTPRLILAARVDEIPYTIGEGGLIYISDNAAIEVRCNGSGTLSWQSSSGTDIPVEIALMPAINVFQRRDPTNKTQTLNIQSFTRMNTAIYTCRTDLTRNGSSIAESIFITNSNLDVYIFGSETKYTLSINASIFFMVISTSSRENLALELYLNGTFINTTNNARYSFGMDVLAGMSVDVLNIINVDNDVFGDYIVRVTVEGRSGNDSFQFYNPVTPTANITYETTGEISMAQRFRVITERGDPAPTFSCVSDGYPVPNLTWSVVGERESFPDGVTETTSTGITPITVQRNLVWSRVLVYTDSGLYQCTSENDINRNFVILDLIVQYPLMVNISYERTGETSRDQLLTLIAEQGDPAPTFSCVSDGFPVPNLIWSVVDERGSFPDGVTETASTGIAPIGVQRNLVWSRALDYTDSGLYQCTSRNDLVETSVILDFLIQYFPIVTSIYPNSPVTPSSITSFLVPEGYSGTILTCAALGWPTPTIEWLKNGQTLDGRIISDSTSNPDSAFVSARLRWTGGFEGSDVGDYTCIVRANDTNAVQSKSVFLNLTIPTTSSPNPIQCSVASLQTYFQIRVFDTECLSWDESLKGNISRSFLNVVLSIIVAECSECNVTTDDVEIIGPPTCSNLVDKAALFRGSISTQQMREDIYCALSNWQQNRPIVQINNRYHLVDSNCSFMLDSPISAECPVFYVMIERPVNTLPFIVSGGSGFALLTLISVGFVYFVYRRRKEKLLSKDASTVNPEIKVDEVAGVHYEYEMESRNINHDLVAGVHLSPEFVNRDTQNSPIAGVYYGNQEVESNSEDAKHRNEISTSDEDLEQAHRRYREQRETRHPDQGTSGMLRLHQGADLENLLYKKLKESNEERQSRTSEEPHYGQEIDYRDQKRRQKYKINTRSDVRYQSTSRGQEVGHREAKRKRKQKASNVEVKPVKFNIPTIVIN